MARRAAAQTKDTPELEKQEAPQLAEPVEVDISEPEAPAAPEPVEVETAPPPASTAPQPLPVDEEKETLRRRVAEMERAERIARESLAQERQRQQQSNVELQRSQRQTFDAQYDSVVNTLGALQSDMAAAKQELRTQQRLVSEGNLDAVDQVAELMERIGRNSADIRGWEYRKQQMENWIEQQNRQPQRQQPPPQQQPQQQQSTVEQVIANSGLPDRAKNWLRQHQDYIQDPAKNAKMQEMHYVAKYQAGSEFTDAYFDRMEELLGHKPSSGNGASQPTTSRQSAPVSAPPTREAPSMATGRAPQPTKVTLNAEQREIAATIAESHKISQAEAERIYAKQLLRMQAEKKDGRHQ